MMTSGSAFVLGIGAQKTASSWVHTVLNAHPDICVARTKEVDFFSYHYDRGYRWYLGQFDTDHNARCRAEVSPSYFHDPRAPERAFVFNPDMRIIVTLRDPVERAFSNHLHEVIKGHIPHCDFATGLANNPAYIDQSRYGAHLSHWFAHFPASQIHVIFNEDIPANPEKIAQELYEFVGLRPIPLPLQVRERRNVSDLARFPMLRRILRSGGDLLRKSGAEQTLSRIKRIRPIQELLRANRLDLREIIPPIAPDLRRELEEAFAPDLEQLSQLLGRRDFPWASWRGAK